MVVCAGDTVVLPFSSHRADAADATPCVAPVVVQLKVDCWPGAMLSGLASKRMICGLPAPPAAPTVTVAVAVIVAGRAGRRQGVGGGRGRASP